MDKIRVGIFISQKKFDEAEKSFVGKVISKKSFKDYAEHRIYTKNIIQITEPLKSEYAKDDLVTLTTQGGELDNIIQIVGHGEDIPKYQEFLFMCQNFNVNQLKGETHLMLYGENSFISIATNSDLVNAIKK